jgi:hypothetical protein
MKKYLSISLLFIFSLTALVPPTIWNDMGKIANLIEHFQEHKKEDASISFWSFLTLHYGKDFQKHQTAHDHSKLPLKNTHPTANALVLVSDFTQPILSLSPKLVVPKKKKTKLYFNQHFISRNLTDIWQPPRAC